MDIRNNFAYHLIVALGSFGLFFALRLSGIESHRALPAVAFTLLFLTLAIGPLMRLWKPAVNVLPWNLPWSWRGELGIWFAIVSIAHMLLVFKGAQWDVFEYLSAMRVGNLVAFIALFWALILTATSFGSVIKFIGVSSWRWLHSFAYVVFYLVGIHVLNHAFFRPGRPSDWLDWSYLVMMLTIVCLQLAAFLITVKEYRKSLAKKDGD
ncbi:MAG: hypothetical protein HYT21_01365 [Candidatus Nealsonbacteria bacterium]|nr:hypothetical protein [Candidatus Nealsonbacteria bacterium]